MEVGNVMTMTGENGRGICDACSRPIPPFKAGVDCTCPFNRFLRDVAAADCENIIVSGATWKYISWKKKKQGDRGKNSNWLDWI